MPKILLKMAGVEIYQLFKLKQNFIKEQVVELKASEFKPEYIGQLGFYVTAINETIKKECDAPTIGLLLCRGKNRVTVDWSLKSTNIPIGVSTYKVKEQLPKELIDKLPTEEEINLYLDIDETNKQ